MDDTSNFLIGRWHKIVNIYVEGLRSSSAVQMNEPHLAADPGTPCWGHWKTKLPLKHKNARNLQLCLDFLKCFFMKFTGIPACIDLLADSDQYPTPEDQSKCLRRQSRWVDVYYPGI